MRTLKDKGKYDFNSWTLKYHHTDRNFSNASEAAFWNTLEDWEFHTGKTNTHSWQIHVLSIRAGGGG